MKNVLIIIFFANLLSYQFCVGGEPNIIYSREMPKISDAARQALSSVLTTADVPACSITSTARTSAQQAKAMYDFIGANSVDAARKLYGSEGNKVVDVYVAQKNAKSQESAILEAMETKIKEVLPEAIKNNHMMHVDRPDYDVFDVSLESVPADKRHNFIAAAKTSNLFHRVLGPDEGEKNCYHFEFKKSQ